MESKLREVAYWKLRSGSQRDDLSEGNPTPVICVASRDAADSKSVGTLE